MASGFRYALELLSLNSSRLSRRGFLLKTGVQADNNGTRVIGCASLAGLLPSFGLLDQATLSTRTFTSTSLSLDRGRPRQASSSSSAGRISKRGRRQPSSSDKVTFVKRSGRTASQITYRKFNPVSASQVGRVVTPLSPSQAGVKVRRWRVYGRLGNKSSSKKTKDGSKFGKEVRERPNYPSNPLRLVYENSHLLSEQVKWMVGKNEQFEMALELVRRHAIRDRKRELEARDGRRRTQGDEVMENERTREPARLVKADETVKRDQHEEQQEMEDEEEEKSPGVWKWKMRVADDEVFNTFISECAAKGQFGWAEAGYFMMLRYRGKPDRITRLALLSALGNAVALNPANVVNPVRYSAFVSQDTDEKREPLPVVFSKQSVRDYYLPLILSRTPGPNFDTHFLNATLKVLARSEAWDEFDRTLAKFVLKQENAPFPSWVGMVGTDSLNPKVRRKLPQLRKSEPHYLTNPKHFPVPDKLTWNTVFSHFSRRPAQFQDDQGMLESVQQLWESFAAEQELDADADLVNSLLTCISNSKSPWAAVDIAGEEFALSEGDWDGSSVHQLADPAVVLGRKRGRAKPGLKRTTATVAAENEKLKKDERQTKAPIPNIKTFSILLECMLRSPTSVSIDAANRVLGWWKSGRFDISKYEEPVLTKVPKKKVKAEKKLDDYCAFLLMRTVGLVTGRGDYNKAEVVVESSAETLWTLFNLLQTNELVEKKVPRTVGVVMDSCWKAARAVVSMPPDQAREAFPSGKNPRLAIWASRGAELWRPLERDVRELGRRDVAGHVTPEDARLRLHLLIAYARLLIDLRHEQRNKDHVARVLTTGMDILGLWAPKVDGRQSARQGAEVRLKVMLASVLRKLANETIGNDEAAGQFIADIKETGWYNSEVHWHGRIGEDAKIRREKRSQSQGGGRERYDGGRKELRTRDGPGHGESARWRDEPRREVSESGFRRLNE